MVGDPQFESPVPPPTRGPGVLPLAVLGLVVAIAGVALLRSNTTETPTSTTATASAAEPPEPVRETLVETSRGLIVCTVEYEAAAGPIEGAEARFDTAGTGETLVRGFADMSVFFSYAHLPETTARIFATVRTTPGAEPLASATALAPDQMVSGETILRLSAVNPDTGSTLDTSCRLIIDDAIVGSR